MKRIIIYCITSIKLRREIEAFLENGCCIVGYSDTNCTEDVVDHKKFIAPQDIKNQNVDYVVIATQNVTAQKEIKQYLVSCGVHEEKVIVPHLLMEPQWACYANSIPAWNMSDAPVYEGMIFGLSYSRYGILKQKLSKRFYDFSQDGMDLYYNFAMYKYIVKHKIRAFSNVKYAILVLPYYYFNYDMSKSFEQYRSGHIFSVYYLHDWHHYELCDGAKEYIVNLELFGDKYADFYHANHYLTEEKHVIAENEECALSNIWHREYSETIAENIKILDDFVHVLVEQSIHVAIINPPMYFKQLGAEDTKAVDKKKEEFYSCLHKSIDKDLYFFMDYTDLYGEKREYFRNYDHLNFQGSIPFTDIVNRDIFSCGAF